LSDSIQRGARRALWFVAVTSCVGAYLCPNLAAQETRIIGDVNASRLVALRGNIHPKARTEYDQGPVDPSLRLRITLALKKSPAQQSALDQLLRAQQDPSSPLFRKWLSPEVYANAFGLNQGDIGKIVEWLQSSGFASVQPARGRDFITFSGTALQVEGVLRTPVHRYLVEGEQHYANVSEPFLPEAIAQVAAGFLGLDDFRPIHPPEQGASSARLSAGSATELHGSAIGNELTGPFRRCSNIRYSAALSKPLRRQRTNTCCRRAE